MSKFHGKMVNIQVDQEAMGRVVACNDLAVAGYKYGHRDARHAAAEIANEADKYIEHLLNENGKLGGDRETILSERDEACEMLKKVADDRDHLAGRLQRLQEQFDLYKEMMGDGDEQAD